MVETASTSTDSKDDIHRQRILELWSDEGETQPTAPTLLPEFISSWQNAMWLGRDKSHEAVVCSHAESWTIVVGFETARLSNVNKFVAISRPESKIRFTDLHNRSKLEKVLPRKLVPKLQSILTDLRILEPSVYDTLMHENTEVDINQIIELLKFIGAESLPDDLDVEDLFRQMKTNL